MALNPVVDFRPEKADIGLHLIGDLYQCRADERYFFDAAHLRAHCIRLVEQAGLTIVGDYFHQFGQDGGVTGTVVLAESHLAIHTWPEKDYVTLDVYVCNYTSNNRPKARKLFNALVETFHPVNPHIRSVNRE
ncbi:MAG TPA: adenosylmethionine decarboxylase [Betaproteobacteria bacterium]|nr:adenosylmethionine decarboxylase [Betaproteobacteria bacterium]